MCSSVVRFSLVVTSASLVFGFAWAGPVQQPREDRSPTTGFETTMWSIAEECFDAESTAVCLKSKALTALDRALSKPTLTLMDGLTLSARSGKSLVDPNAEQTDRAALTAIKDSDQKNALLDDMLADRLNELWSTRSIVIDGPEEGRKKRDKTMQQTMMMAGMTAAAVMGPMAIKIIALMAVKALLLSKIALVLSGLMVLKKIVSQSSNQDSDHSSHSGWGRSIKLVEPTATSATAQNMAFSAQLK